MSFGLYFPLTRKVRGSVRFYGLHGLIILYILLCIVGVADIVFLVLALVYLLVRAIVRAIVHATRKDK